MPIPANYFRLGWVLNARGPSGERMVTMSGNWAQPPGSTMTIGDPAWFEQGTTWADEAFSEDLRPAFANTTQNIGAAWSLAGGGGTVNYNGVLGSRSITLAPPQMAGVVQLRTDTVGRKGRGRMFIPDVAESDFDASGIVNPTAATIWFDAVAALIESMDNNITGSEFATGLNGAHILHADGSTPTRITGVTINPQPGWLRRRGR